MWTVANTYIIVRKAEKDTDVDVRSIRRLPWLSLFLLYAQIPQYDQAQVILKGSLKSDEGFFSNLDFADVIANGTCQPVLVKRFANETVSISISKLEQL